MITWGTLKFKNFFLFILIIQKYLLG